MDKFIANSEHKNFKKDVRSCRAHDRRTNRYNLKRIAGKYDMFESDVKKVNKNIESAKDTPIVDRDIPNSELKILKLGDFYAIGGSDGEPLTEFKYRFIEGCLGDVKKVIRCITDDGKVEDFSVRDGLILSECCGAAIASNGMGVGQLATSGCGGGKKEPYHEINYSEVKNSLKIPYLCGARLIDIGKRRKKKR